MKNTSRAAMLFTLALFMSWTVLCQERQVGNTDTLREQIKKLESINVEGKSSAIQTIHRRALLDIYKQLQAAVSQEILDLKSIRAALGNTNSDTQREIAAQLLKLGQENSAVSNRIQGLMSASRTFAGSEGSPSLANGATASLTISTESLMASTDARSGMVQPHGAGVFGSPDGSRPGNLVNSTLNSEPNSAAADPSAGSQTGTRSTSSASTSLNADLNTRVKEAARAKIQQRETTKQAETPTISNSSTSLVDTSSAGDLVNVGLSLAGLTGGTTSNSNNATSVSVTASAYSLFAASQGVDPLNPGFYNRHGGWRKLSFTLGYDDEKLPTGVTQRAQIFGAKYLIIDKRDPARERNKESFKTIGDNLEKAAVAFGRLDEKISYYFTTNRTVKEKILVPQFRVFLNEKLKTLQSQTASSQSEAQRISDDSARITGLLARIDTGQLFFLDANGLPPNRGEPGQWTREELEFFSDNFRAPYLGTGYRAKLKDSVGQQVLDDLDAFINKQLTDTRVFEDLSDSTREAIEEIRRAPQFSFYFLTKQRPDAGVDEYTGEAIFDYGLANRLNLTLNGNYMYKDSKIVGGDIRGGKFSGQFRFQMTPERLTGKNPLFLAVSGDAEAFSGKKPAFHAQAKLTIPLLNGLDLPFSVTYANQKGLIKENKIRGQFGFSIDTARFLQALTGK